MKESKRSFTESLKATSTAGEEEEEEGTGAEEPERRKRVRERTISLERHSRERKHLQMGSWSLLDDARSVKWRRQIKRPLDQKIILD